MKYVIPVILGLWIVGLPFKNAAFELSSAFMIGLSAAYILWSAFRARSVDLPALPVYLSMGFVAVVGSMVLSNYLGRDTTDGYWIPAHFFVRYGGTFGCLYYLYFKGFFKKEHLYTWLMVSLVIQALMGVQQSFDHYDYLRDRAMIHGNRVYGGTFNPNTFGLLMAIGAAICSWHIMHFRQLSLAKAAGYGLLLALMGYGLLLSGSRSAWLSYLVFLCVSAWMSAHFRVRHALVGMTALGSTLLLLVGFTDQVPEQLQRILLLDSSNRTAIWQAAWQYFLASPWTGHGPGGFDQLSGMPYSAIHNCVLEILVYTGLLGLLAYTLLGLGLAQLASRAQSPLLTALLISIAIASLFDHSLFDSKIYLSISVVLVFLLATHRNRVERPVTAMERL